MSRLFSGLTNGPPGIKHPLLGEGKRDRKQLGPETEAQGLEAGLNFLLNPSSPILCLWELRYVLYFSKSQLSHLENGDYVMCFTELC